MSDFFKRQNWKSLEDNPLANNLIKILICFILILTIFTIYITSSYFSRNEILLGISDKYVTTKSDSIKDIIDTSTIHNEFNNNLQSNGIANINDTITKEVSNGYPTKHIIEKIEKESFELGDIGDFIGGYFGFLIGVIGALLTFLAFYIQYKANKDVQKQFALQQFESQFHKMIDVYLNNKDKFSIVGYKNPTNRPIDLLQIPPDDINKKLNLVNDFYSNQNITFIEFTTKDHIVFQKFLVELKVIYRVFLEAYKEELCISEKDLNKEIKKILFKEAYNLFFNGLNQYKKTITSFDFYKYGIENSYKSTDNEYKIHKLFSDFITKCEKLEFNGLETFELGENIKARAIFKLEILRKIHKNTGTKIFNNFYRNENEYKTLWLKLNYTPFQGYLHFLPQYYRNLYSIVKYVVSDNADLDSTQKSKYLRILRSTMSEHEQTLLYYNWLSDTAPEWENNENKFLSYWKMIDNLNSITLIDEDLNFETIPSN